MLLIKTPTTTLWLVKTSLDVSRFLYINRILILSTSFYKYFAGLTWTLWGKHGEMDEELSYSPHNRQQATEPRGSILC